MTDAGRMAPRLTPAGTTRHFHTGASKFGDEPDGSRTSELPFDHPKGVIHNPPTRRAVDSLPSPTPAPSRFSVYFGTHLSFSLRRGAVK